MTKRHRQPRPPAPANGLPATYIEAEEDLIVRSLAKWWEFRSPLLTAEKLYVNFEAAFYDMLAHPEDETDAAIVVERAEFGHPSADAALRRFIAAALDNQLVPKLPVCVQNYARKGIQKAPLRGYPPRGDQVWADYGRDLAIAYCVDCVVRRHPTFPRYKARGSRRSAADLVATAFGFKSGERQVGRIHKASGKLDRRLAEFFMWPVGTPVGTNEKFSFGA